MTAAAWYHRTMTEDDIAPGDLIILHPLAKSTLFYVFIVGPGIDRRPAAYCYRQVRGHDGINPWGWWSLDYLALGQRLFHAR